MANVNYKRNVRESNKRRGGSLQSNRDNKVPKYEKSACLIPWACESVSNNSFISANGGPYKRQHYWSSSSSSSSSSGRASPASSFSGDNQTGSYPNSWGSCHGSSGYQTSSSTRSSPSPPRTQAYVGYKTSSSSLVVLPDLTKPPPNCLARLFSTPPPAFKTNQSLEYVRYQGLNFELDKNVPFASNASKWGALKAGKAIPKDKDQEGWKEAKKVTEKLVQAGILPEPYRKPDPKVFDPDVDTATVNQLYKANGLSKCSHCGMTFEPVEEADKYRDHVDEHVRQNLKDVMNKKHRKAISRPFYVPASVWTDQNYKVKMLGVDTAEKALEELRQQKNKQPAMFPMLHSKGKVNQCYRCLEEFDTKFLMDDDVRAATGEGWYFHDAIQNQDGSLVHSGCE